MYMYMDIWWNSVFVSCKSNHYPQRYAQKTIFAFSFRLIDFFLFQMTHLDLLHYKSLTALSGVHHLTCGISSFLHSVNVVLFTLLLVHLILHTSPQSLSSLSPSVTPSAFHSRFKTHRFHNHRSSAQSVRSGMGHRTATYLLTYKILSSIVLDLGFGPV